MNENNQNNTDSKPQQSPQKRGFISRLIEKLDQSMKQQAEEKSKQGNSCCGGKGNGGKCC